MISRHASFPMTKTGSKRVIAETRIPNCQGIMLLLFPILSCARIEYEAHYVRYYTLFVENSSGSIHAASLQYVHIIRTHAVQRPSYISSPNMDDTASMVFDTLS